MYYLRLVVIGTCCKYCREGLPIGFQVSGVDAKSVLRGSAAMDDQYPSFQGVAIRIRDVNVDQLLA